MAFKFESLQIWKLAFRLADEVHNIAIAFPRVEMFSLSSQIKRAADSVVLNIAEGSTGLTSAEFKRFLNISLRSAIEVVSCLMIAQKRGYIKEENFQQLYNDYEHLCKMVTSFRNNLK